MTATQRRGDWMQTFTGRAFWPLDPRSDEIDPIDIGHALALLCRFNGHVRRFYSVAEHCVLMSQAVAPEHALWALLHDATEAYVGDLIRPLKRNLPAYAAAEDNLMDFICQRFGIEPGCPAEVKTADNRILLNERAALMPGPPPLPWAQDKAGLDPLPVQVEGWSPRVAEIQYLARLDVLWGGL